MASTVPQPTFGPDGFIEPDEADILAAVQADINAAFGGTLSQNLETPQGQLASSMTAIIGNVNDTFLWYTQQADPAYASGRMQDALARIYFIERLGAEPTVVTATCVGLSGVVIPQGSVAVAADGNLYTCTDGGTIPIGGSIDLQFACNTLGPIQCPAGTLNSIYRSINGWDSISNAENGTIGRDTESRSQFEERRFLSVANNSLGALPSIQGAVLLVPNVLDAYVTENFTSAPLTIGGYTLAAKSVYVAAVGGTNDAVAKAIWTKKAPGCAYNGNTTVTVFDTDNYNPPYPSYDVKFERPASIPIIFAVSIVDSAQVPADAATQVQNTIINAFAGGDGGPRARIGSTIYASRFYGPVSALGAWAQIIAIDVGSQNTSAAEITGTIDDGAGGVGNELTVISTVSGAVATGQTIVGDGVTPGTTVVSGSDPNWIVSIAQKVTPTQTLFGVLADQNDVAVQIDQTPTVSSADIVVTLS